MVTEPPPLARIIGNLDHLAAAQSLDAVRTACVQFREYVRQVERYLETRET